LMAEDAAGLDDVNSDYTHVSCVHFALTRHHLPKQS
jgi:hypothetical protein